jgi:hypothetical protein
MEQLTSWLERFTLTWLLIGMRTFLFHSPLDRTTGSNTLVWYLSIWVLLTASVLPADAVPFDHCTNCWGLIPVSLKVLGVYFFVYILLRGLVRQREEAPPAPPVIRRQGIITIAVEMVGQQSGTIELGIPQITWIETDRQNLRSY